MAERSWAREFTRMGAVAWKDLAVERRTKANFNSVVFFAALTLLLFGFALGADTDALKAASGGVLWLTVLFSGVLVFNRSYQTELDTGALEALLLYPGERWAIFGGKLIANLAFVVLVEAVILPVAVVLYHMPLNNAPFGVIAVMLLGTLGFVTLGTFYA
ncbi:MAG: heme exporter protein CcmB, partial [Gaiellaceae bacterium]